MAHAAETLATLPQIASPQFSGNKGDNLEVTFTSNDLLFSRTDERGVIQSVNSAFQTISGFETVIIGCLPLYRLLRAAICLSV